MVNPAHFLQPAGTVSVESFTSFCGRVSAGLGYLKVFPEFALVLGNSLFIFGSPLLGPGKLLLEPGYLIPLLLQLGFVFVVILAEPGSHLREGDALVMGSPEGLVIGYVETSESAYNRKSKCKMKAQDKNIHLQAGQHLSEVRRT